MKILCGADPELAVVDSYGAYVPCVGLFPGTKDNPHKVEGSSIGLTVQEDGVSLEIGFDPVDIDDFDRTIYTALNEVVTYVNHVHSGYSVRTIDAAVYDPSQLTSEQASKFGCDPDFDAYNRGAMRPSPTPELMGNLRCFAGHIHIGYDKQVITPDVLPDWALVQGIEAFGYLPALIAGEDPQKNRRRWYGVPGLYRSKNYGVEYRTPSNAWLRNRTLAVEIVKVAQIILSRPRAYANMYHSIDWDMVHKIISAGGARPGSSTFWYDMELKFDALRNEPEEI